LGSSREDLFSAKWVVAGFRGLKLGNGLSKS